MHRRRNRKAEQARQRANRKKLSEVELEALKLQEEIRKWNLYDYFMKKSIDLKHALVDRSNELELRAGFFMSTLSPHEKPEDSRLNTLLYEQGMLDGRLHYMKEVAFKELMDLKAELIKQGVREKRVAMEAELAQILMSYDKVKDCSSQFSKVLMAHIL